MMYTPCKFCMNLSNGKGFMDFFLPPYSRSRNARCLPNKSCGPRPSPRPKAEHSACWPRVLIHVLYLGSNVQTCIFNPCRLYISPYICYSVSQAHHLEMTSTNCQTCPPFQGEHSFIYYYKISFYFAMPSKYKVT